MYLKELTLRGFKSFASATTLRFEPGITAVVGPNGSGKSNIVDALAWVMGEQGAKTLRGSSMEDVIFAGTSSRPPLGRAQVSLTIDNTDHALDIEYSEVTISRTIFRSGGSEYAINGSPVRLLDIQDLLSDTGLGSQMHVIVGQGRLSSILHADPAGHRAIIEEAAGILKHRKRKERSLRKLKSTQDNLARLDDLLSEINRQLGPLGRQARISRRAEGIQVTIRDAKARLLADDASQLHTQREANRAALGEIRSRLGTQQRELARTKLRIEQLEQQSSAANPLITGLTDSMHRLSQIDERYAALASLVEERERTTRSQEGSRPTADPEILEARAADLDAQAEKQTHEAQNLKVAQEKATEARASTEAQLAAARQTLAQLRRSTKERESNVARLQQLMTRQETLLDSSAKRTADFKAQQESVAEQLSAVSSEIDDLKAQAATLETQDSDADDEIGTALAGAQDELQKLRDEQQGIEKTKIRLEARAEALKDTVDQRRTRTSLSKETRVHSLGSVATFIHVEEGWEEAIACALSHFSSAMVVGEARDLETALAIAQEKKTEQTALLTPWTARRQTSAAESSRDPSLRDSLQAGAPDGAQTDLRSDLGTDVRADSQESGNGAIRPAASLVSPAQAAAETTETTETSAGIVAAIKRLLSDVGVSETWRSAQEFMRHEHETATLQQDGGTEGTGADGHGAWREIITKDGEIVTAVGVVTTPRSAPSDLSLVARRQKSLEESAQLGERLATLEKSIGQAQERVDSLKSQLTALTALRTERKTKAREVATAVKMRDRQVEEYRRRQTHISQSLDSIAKEVLAATAKRDELAAALEQARESGDDSFNLEDFEKRESTLEKDLSSAREVEMAAKLAAAEASRKQDSLSRQARLLHDDATHAATQRRDYEDRQKRRQKTLKQLGELLVTISGVRSLLAVCIRQVKAQREAAQAQASVHDEELTQLRHRRNELEPIVERLTAQEHENDVSRERYATQFGQLTQKINDELGMQMEALIEEYGPDKPVPVLNEQGEPVPVSDESPETHQTVPYVRSEQEKRLRKAEADVSKLGKINPLAMEEFDALQERHSYLNEQRNDVAQSRDNLMHIVKDLDATMERAFKEAFDDVAEAFEKIFAVLFPGGTGRLRLENSEDLLNTGVLVEASPAGKRVKQLSLLSGGEKSLTALALLLAVFTARPSPFYVMDEVEAALDDINLTRLLEALKQLREHAQLIIITHQQRTMAIADALYGITMRSDGVTAVISQKMEKTEKMPRTEKTAAPTPAE